MTDRTDRQLGDATVLELNSAGLLGTDTFTIRQAHGARTRIELTSRGMGTAVTARSSIASADLPELIRALIARSGRDDLALVVGNPDEDADDDQDDEDLPFGIGDQVRRIGEDRVRTVTALVLFGPHRGWLYLDGGTRHAHGSTDPARYELAEPETSPPAPGSSCPHCPDGHTPADRHSQPWVTRVGGHRDEDGQPLQIIVERSGLAHVADSDAAWIWRVLNSPNTHSA